MNRCDVGSGYIISNLADGVTVSKDGVARSSRDKTKQTSICFMLLAERVQQNQMCYLFKIIGNIFSI